MTNQLRPALVLLVVLTLMTGVLYPLAMLGIGQLVFPHQANGSLIPAAGPSAPGRSVLGSDLIGQSFEDPVRFWGRLSATSPAPFNAASSSGSNLGPTNPALQDAVRARVKALRAADPDNAGPVPVDLATASGSGLDPDISPAAARYQVARVAKARRLAEDQVLALVDAQTEGRQFGVLGEPRVNVLRLNLALDRLHPMAGATRGTQK